VAQSENRASTGTIFIFDPSIDTPYWNDHPNRVSVKKNPGVFYEKGEYRHDHSSP
jgi:hypothetical protein